jgi:hypothetical protein
MSEGRHTGGPTADELDFCQMIAREAGRRAIPFGRAVFLFGLVVRRMVVHAAHVEPDQSKVLDTYARLFFRGMGALQADISTEVIIINPKERH